jgi:hypothetical protein
VDDNRIGDLKGFTERLSYFVDLGVDAIWISDLSVANGRLRLRHL